MNEHAGPACALSVLIVGIFAVLLHDRGRPPVTSKAVAPEVKGTEAPRLAPGPDRVSPAPHRETAIVAPVPKAVERPTASRDREPAPRNDEGPPRKSETKPSGAASSRPVPRTRPRARVPRSPFAVVEQGETLADVATRVYGSPGATEAIWKANRDQIARIDSPLARGTLLRTP